MSVHFNNKKCLQEKRLISCKGNFLYYFVSSLRVSYTFKSRSMGGMKKDLTDSQSNFYASELPGNLESSDRQKIQVSVFRYGAFVISRGETLPGFKCREGKIIA